MRTQRHWTPIGGPVRPTLLAAVLRLRASAVEMRKVDVLDAATFAV